MMRILILGSGGRECAMAWKLSSEIGNENVFIAPGNAGTQLYGTNVELNILDFVKIGQFCLANTIEFILPGGEDSLVAGIVDYFKSNSIYHNIFVFGPDKTAAALEGSKEFAKKFMQKNNIPTAGYQSFIRGEEIKAKKFVRTLNKPYVIKADGLAAGKGVVIVDSLNEADDCIDEMLIKNQFGEAGGKIVIEEFLSGIEVSYFAITDGKNFIMMPEAKDYKRIGENDTGPNTGGMGAVSPVGFVDAEFNNKVMTRIIKPTMAGLIKEAFSYIGFVFFGLINVDGHPYVIEYNCRMGDPETEVVLPRMNNSISDIIEKSKDKKLNEVKTDIKNDYCVTVMLVSGGYPGDYSKNKNIEISEVDNMMFHSGTTHLKNQLVTNGGRVMAVSAFGKNLKEAINESYKTINHINFDNMYYRKDIGKDLIKIESHNN